MWSLFVLMPQVLYRRNRFMECMPLFRGEAKSNSVPHPLPHEHALWVYSFLPLLKIQAGPTTLLVSLRRTFPLQELILTFIQIKTSPSTAGRCAPQMGCGAPFLVLTPCARMTRCYVGPFRVGYRDEEQTTDKTSSHHL